MKKFYTLLTALAATVAMSAETYELNLYPVDFTGSSAVTTSTPVKCNVDINGNSATFNNLLESGVTPTFTFEDEGSKITCDLKGWKQGTYNLGTIGTGTEMYFEYTCGNYTTATWNATYHRFTFYSWVTLDGADDSDTYGFVVEMPESFLNEPEEQTLNCTGYFWDDDAYDYVNKFSFTQTAKVGTGAVTLTNFLGSGKDVDFEVYNDGTAKQITFDDDVAGSFTFGSTTFDYVTLDGGTWSNAVYVADTNRLWYATYAYVGEAEYEIGFYVNLPEDFTPAEAPEKELWGEGNIKVNVYGAEGYQNGTYDGSTLVLTNYLGSGKDFTFNISEVDGVKTVSSTDAAAYTDIDVTINGTHYVQLYTYGSQYISYVPAETGDYIAWFNYIYDESGAYYGAYTLIYIPEAAGATFDRDSLLGKYSGNIGTYEYLYNYGSSPAYEYDGTTNAYVEISAGEAEDEVIIKNLIPTSYDRIHVESLTGKVAAYNEYDGYKAYIEIAAGKVGTLDYYYGADLYTLDAWLGASWTTNWCSGPTENVYFYVADDGTISTDWTGWAIWMDWTGDGTTFYGALYTGTASDKLVKVEDSGVKAISVDNSNASVEFFNLSGVRVNGDNLTPGLYIRRQGTQASKVIVK